MSTNDHGDDDGWGKPAYEVGYGKPPKKHQFKKGQSGNPRGRKPRTKNASKLLMEELDRLITVREGDGEKRVTKLKAFMTSLVNDAIKGKAAARQLILNLMHVEPQAEPFIADTEDEAALEAFLQRQLQAGHGSGNEDDPDEEPT